MSRREIADSEINSEEGLFAWKLERAESECSLHVSCMQENTPPTNQDRAKEMSDASALAVCTFDASKSPQSVNHILIMYKSCRMRHESKVLILCTRSASSPGVSNNSHLISLSHSSHSSPPASAFRSGYLQLP